MGTVMPRTTTGQEALAPCVEGLGPGELCRLRTKGMIGTRERVPLDHPSHRRLHMLDGRPDAQKSLGHCDDTIERSFRHQERLVPASSGFSDDCSRDTVRETTGDRPDTLRDRIHGIAPRTAPQEIPRKRGVEAYAYDILKRPLRCMCPPTAIACSTGYARV